MASRSVGERLLDIREAATDLRDFVADMDTEAFHALAHADRMAYRAAKNALSELGEAVKAIPEDIRKRHAGVDWKGFAGLRDLVAHQYFGLDTSRLLPIIRDAIPGLLAAVETELQRLGDANPPAPGGKPG
jgi:uncharacterized protein with HEPN domain